MRDPLVRVEDLVVRYGGQEAVRGVTFEVWEGEVVGLIGPDGAGKTSTLRVIAGLLRSSAGRVRVFGMEPWRHRRRLHRSVGYLPQRFALFGDLTVDENMHFFALLFGVPNWKPRRDELLERVGLAPFRDRVADRLSGGMRQKLALATCLLHAPTLLLLDESTTGVDPVTRRELWSLLSDLVTQGLTLVVATPYLDEAERCSRVILMHEGTVLADGPPRTLAALVPGELFEVDASPRERARRLLEELPNVVDVQAFGARLHVRLLSQGTDAAHLRGSLQAAGCEVRHVRAMSPRLEDVFLHLTRGARCARGAPP